MIRSRRSSSIFSACSDRRSQRSQRVLHGPRDRLHPHRAHVLPAEVVDELSVGERPPLPRQKTLALLVGRVTTLKLAYSPALPPIHLAFPRALPRRLPPRSPPPHAPP